MPSYNDENILTLWTFGKDLGDPSFPQTTLRIAAPDELNSTHLFETNHGIWRFMKQKELKAWGMVKKVLYSSATVVSWLDLENKSIHLKAGFFLRKLGFKVKRPSSRYFSIVIQTTPHQNH